VHLATQEEVIDHHLQPQEVDADALPPLDEDAGETLLTTQTQAHLRIATLLRTEVILLTRNERSVD